MTQNENDAHTATAGDGGAAPGPVFQLNDPARGETSLSAYRSGEVVTIEVEEPWAGSTETGFGQTCSIGASLDEARSLGAWLLATTPLSTAHTATAGDGGLREPPTAHVSQKPGWIERAAHVAGQIIDLMPRDPDLQPERGGDGLALPHLLFMADELHNRRLDSETKACRWLGWLQAGVVAAGISDLETMKELNLASGGVTALATPPPAQEPGTGDMGEPDPFAVGTTVEKSGGEYLFPGTVVASFLKLGGQRRYVVEDDRRSLHIFSAANLRATPATTAESRGPAEGAR